MKKINDSDENTVVEISPPSAFAKVKEIYPKVGCDLGKYSDLQPIGEGGLAKVYKAYDKELNRFVALKVLKRGAFAPNAIKGRFKKEIQAQANLSVSGTVSIFDAGECKGWFFYAMELIEGNTLKYYIGNDIISTQEKIQIILKLAKLLQIIHNKKLIHRDIKPSNVMLDNQGDIKLLDFGLVKILSNDLDEGLQTKVGEVAGSPAYMSPEMTYGLMQSGDAYSADIYSLGVLSYELLTGNFPYDIAELSSTKIFKIIRDAEPDSLRKHKANIPKKLDSIILRTLNKNSNDRIPLKIFIKEIENFDSKKNNKLLLFFLSIFILIVGFFILQIVQLNNKTEELPKFVKTEKEHFIYLNSAPKGLCKIWKATVQAVQSGFYQGKGVLIFEIPKNSILLIHEDKVEDPYVVNSKIQKIGVISTTDGIKMILELRENGKHPMFFKWLPVQYKVDTLF